MSAVHDIQWSVSSAVLALHIPEPNVPIPKRQAIPSLQAFAAMLLPLGMVTAAALLVIEVKAERSLPPAVFGSEEVQRLDIAATEPLLLQPVTITALPMEAPPMTHAAAPEDVSWAHPRFSEEPEWQMTPPPIPETTVHSAAPLPQNYQRGVFLTPSSAADDGFLEETMKAIEKYPHPALVIDVKGSNVHFPSGARMAHELKLVKPIVALPAIVEEAHRRGITVIGRYIALKDPSLASRKPVTQIRHPLRSRSVGNVWVDGENTTTLQYNREILEDLVTTGIDEINLDYIRYPTEYAPSDIGLTGAEKSEHILAFLKMARDVIDRSQRPVKLGISTYAILGWNFPVNFEAVGQNIPEFARIVDVVSPMAYPATFAPNAYYSPGRDKGSRMYHLVWKTVMGYRGLVGEENAHKIRPWIQGYGVTEKNMQDQIQAVFHAGGCGFTVWNASNAYATTYKAMKKMEIPETCQN